MLSTLNDLVTQYLADIAFVHPNETPEERAARVVRIKQNHDLIYLEIVDTFEDISGTGGGGGTTTPTSRNIDGGAANTVYLVTQRIDGGGA